MTIEEKLRSALSADDTGSGPTSRCHDAVPMLGKQWTEWELDLLDWGMVYGMAFSLVREEEPWESHENVAKRAVDVARAAAGCWGSSPMLSARPEIIEPDVADATEVAA